MGSRHSSIVAVKLRAPRLRHDVVRRPRLSAAVERAAPRVLLVSAPAGSGKTVFVLDWLEATGASHVWLSLDSQDNDFARFRAHLAAALDSAGCDACAGAAAALRSLGVYDGSEPDGALLAAFEAIPPELVLVLDDLHTLESREVLGLLQALVTRTATGPRYALLTRTDPPLPLARLRLAGELHEVREDELRFTLEEAGELLGLLLPEPLEPALLQRLEQKTEGWAAGLRLAAIALERAPDRRAAVTEFAGTHRVVVDYLLEEAVRVQEPELQWFLCATSILPRFTAETCAAVLDSADAEELLQQVESRRLFLVTLGGGWYRYHHLFAELLEFRLRREHRDRLEALHGRASAWFASQGDMEEALRQASRMEDRTQLVRLLDAYGLELVSRSELATLGRWSALVPDPCSQPYPGFLAALIWYRLLSEREPDLAGPAAAARAALQAAAAGGTVAGEAHRLTEAALQLDIAEAFRLRLAGRVEESITRTETVLERLPGRSGFAAGLVLYNLGAARLAQCEARARQTLEESFEVNLRDGPQYLMLSSLALLSMALSQQEGVAAARARLDAAQPLLRELGLERLPAYGMVLWQRGWLAWLEDELDAAAAELREAVRLATRGVIVEATANALVLLARVEAARDRGTRADECLAEAVALSTTRTVTLIGTSLPAESVRLDLLRGRTAAAPLPAEPGPGTWTAAAEAAASVELLRWIRTGQANDATARVAGIAGRLLEHAVAEGRGVAELVARTALALAEADRQRRWSMVDELLCLAGTRGYLRPLLDGGPRVHRLLVGALGQPLSPQARETARVLLDRFGDDMTAPATGAAPTLAVPLTDRELDVLACLARSMSNKAIARTMFVSPDTVKTHLRHIYDKLGVTDRATAVERARELNLLPVTA